MKVSVVASRTEYGAFTVDVPFTVNDLVEHPKKVKAAIAKAAQDVINTNPSAIQWDSVPSEPTVCSWTCNN